jgi:hypothetical protein
MVRNRDFSGPGWMPKMAVASGRIEPNPTLLSQSAHDFPSLHRHAERNPGIGGIRQ